MPKVTVTFTETSRFTAMVDYDDLVKAIGEDIDDQTGQISRIPLIEDIRAGYVLAVTDKEAGEALTELIADEGSEVDSFFPVIEGIEVMP